MYKNEMWKSELDIGALFGELQRSNPDHVVTIKRKSEFGYPEVKRVLITELTPHSVWRNTVGLFRG